LLLFFDDIEDQDQRLTCAGCVAKNLDKYAQRPMRSGDQQNLLRQTKQSMDELFLTDDI
jgi:hypothetical protein